MIKKLSSLPLFNVLLFTFFWATQVFVTKIAFIKGIDVVPFAIQSSILTIFIVSLYIFVFKKNKLTKISGTIIIWLLIASAIHGGLGIFLSNVGINLTSAINAGFLIQFSTVTTAILAWIILKEKMTASKALTIIMIMIGTFFLITKGKLDSPAIGDVFILFACLSWSTGNVLIRMILKKNTIDSDVATFFRPLGGLPLFLILVLMSPLYPQKLQPFFQANLFNFNLIFYVFLNAFFTLFLWIFLNKTLKIASASYMTMMSSLTPLIVAILALVFLRESLLPIQYLGGFLILISGLVTHFLKIEKH
jgi:drug/metabolite transporter (DMT)-like permease